MINEAKEPVCKTCRGRQLYRLLEPTEDEVNLSDTVPCPTCGDSGKEKR
ncbi:hypothetical protein LCGC14_1826920 [marine sediment metagenome]|uniref:Uncharacterized protein n=1 Tax=marine sediment metagenome TaxID=412755 RepID=A0A0F9GH53_9ZZZZ